MSDSSTKFTISFEASPPDNPNRKRPKRHKQIKILGGGLAISISSSHVRDGEYFDLSRAELLLKGLDLYGLLRDPIDHTLGTSGRTFERIIHDGDGVTLSELSELCDWIVDASFDGEPQGLGVTQEVWSEALLHFAQRRWVAMPTLEDMKAGAASEACALALVRLRRSGNLISALNGVLASVEMEGIQLLPQAWFEGKALGWLLRTVRAEMRLTQQKIVESLGSSSTISARTIGRWERSECLPAGHYLKPLAKAICSEDPEIAAQLLIWMKFARLVDYSWRQDEDAHLNPELTAWTPEYWEQWKLMGREHMRKCFEGTLFVLQRLSDEHFDLCADAMMCGAIFLSRAFLEQVISNYGCCPQLDVCCEHDSHICESTPHAALSP